MGLVFQRYANRNQRILAPLLRMQSSPVMWAAVTSGEEAIGVHLLACMLARMWNGTEATSVWDEIVTKRKLEISQRVENSAYSTLPSSIGKSSPSIKIYVARSTRAGMPGHDHGSSTQTKRRQGSRSSSCSCLTISTPRSIASETSQQFQDVQLFWEYLRGIFSLSDFNSPTNLQIMYPGLFH